MYKTTRLCTSLLRSATLPIRTSLAPPLFIVRPVISFRVKCQHYSTKGTKPEVPKEALEFLETLREQYKPQEDQITMEQAEANVHNWAKEGEELLNEGKLERALKCFNKVIDLELPEGYGRTVDMREYTASAYIGRAFVKVQTEKTEEALQDYQYLLENWDDNPEVMANAYHDRAMVRFQTGDCENALSDINKCLDGKLRKTEYAQEQLDSSYQLRAHIYADLNKQSEALADANYLLDKKKNIENYMFRSNLYHEFGKMEEAKKDLDVADEMGADDAAFWFSRSLIYVELPGGSAEATKSLKKAIRRDPSLQHEIEDFPILKPIFEAFSSIEKSRTGSGSSSPSIPPALPAPSGSKKM